MKKKNFINIAKEVIDLEITALKNLKKNLNNSFNSAVKHIVRCQSKVILCGVGKSGLLHLKLLQLFLQSELHHFIFLREIHLMVTWVVYRKKIY